MAELNLESGEYAITQLSDVSINRGSYDTDLVLTNRNLIIVKKTMWTGRTKDLKKYRIDQIPVVNGRGQLKIEKTDGGRKCTILLKTGEELKITAGRDVDFAEFASQINLLLTGTPTIPHEKGRNAVDEIAGAFQSAFAALDPRTHFGGQKASGNQQAQQAAQPPRAAYASCIGCHAPISGYTGQVVTCGYCDTEQRLVWSNNGNR